MSFRNLQAINKTPQEHLILMHIWFGLYLKEKKKRKGKKWETSSPLQIWHYISFPLPFVKSVSDTGMADLFLQTRL